MTLRAHVVCLSLSSGALAAQEVVFSPDANSQCLADGDFDTDCIGASAERCMDESVGGYSTPGMNGCLGAERAFWDDELNAAFGAILALERETGADPADDDQLSGEDALRKMQRAWIACQDGTGNYEVLQ